MFFIIAILFLAFMGSLTSAFADSILLKSGEVVKGTITSQDTQSLQMDTGVGVSMTYFRDQISDITVDKKSDNPKDQADALENKAVRLIDEGKRDEGLDLLQQALTLSPTPLRFMNMGSVLFGDGVELFKQGNKVKGTALLQQSKDSLLKAIEGFDSKADNIYLGQCYFLLAEIYAHAFDDQAQAKMLYQQAVNIGDHPGAKIALENIAQ